MRYLISVFLIIFTLTTYSQTTKYKTLGSWNSSGVPDYLEKKDDIISNDLLSGVDKSLPEGKKLTDTHPEYLVESNSTNIIMKESADVWIIYVSEGAGYKNVLGFYTYNRNNSPSSVSDIENTMTIIFPNVSNNGSGGGLTPGNKVYLGEFESGTAIGWFLLADGFESNASITDGNWRLFSNSNLNPENNSDLRQHNILLNDGDERAILGFEDIRRDSKDCDQDFNDVTFFITANPKEAIDFGDIPDIEKPSVGTDCLDYDIVFEGVENDLDNNTSTWTYSVSAENSAKDLSHWALGLCNNHKVLLSNYNYEIPTGGDPTTGVEGIKWDVEVKTGRTKTFSFVLEGIFPVEDVEVGVKTGGRTKTQVCTIPGPGCTAQVTEADLEINKEIDADCLNDADNIKYTVSLKNNGPSNATGVKVSDILPLGLTDITYSASKGSFDFESGLWNVGSVYNSGTETLEIYARVKKSLISGGSVNLGPANGFNVFVLENLEQSSSDTEGKMAIGQDAKLSSYSVGEKLTSDGEDVLIVGNDLEFQSGSVLHGNVVYGGSTNLPTQTVNVSGSISQGTPIDFDNAESYLKTLSDNLADLLVNGTTKLKYSTLNLTGTNVNLNIFKVDNTQLYYASEIKIEVPENSVAIVNIEGEKVKLRGNIILQGTDKTHILFNMHKTKELKVEGINVLGSILAPKADMEFSSGVVNGQVIVKSVEGNGQFNYSLFAGSLNDNDITVINTASIIAADQKDPDNSNNSDSVESGFCTPTEPDKVDLVITKTIDTTGCYSDGSDVVYTLTVKNNGPANANGVEVTDVLPKGLTNVYGSTSSGSFSPASGVWNIGTIANGESAVLTINSVLNFDELDPDDKDELKLTNIAAISSVEQEETLPADNTASAVIDICEPVTEVDIEVLKSVDNESPEDGDIITFTVTVTNKGPAATTGIKITDVMPKGFANIDFVTSQGNYTYSTGIWEVGDLANGASAEMTATGTVDLAPLYTTTFDLGPAKGFGLFVLKDIVQPSSDTEGKAAIGRNATFSRYSVGHMLENSNGLEDVLIVGNHLQFNSGDVYNGNAVYGNSTNLPIDLVGVRHGTLRKDKPIDFDKAETYLIGLSQNLKSKTANGSAKYEFSELALKGTDPFVNIFDVERDDLNATTNVKITAPNGSVVIVNIKGDSLNWSGGLSVVGTSITNVIYNFPDAKDIHIDHIDITGSILAPKAHLDYPSGVVNGQVICRSMEGSGQFNNVLFLGEIPGEGNIENTASLLMVNETDTNPDNNSATAAAVIATDLINIDPGTGTNVEWESVAEFASSEIIWTMSADKDGAPIAGTWGGNIYRFNGSGWIKINEGMGAGFIWSFAVNKSNGNIYCGTEKGVFLSTDNGNSWNPAGLADYDVRALAYDNNGKLYAGTWGAGLYELSGSTWDEVSTGYENLAIHALVFNSFNDLFVGTFDRGIYKRDNFSQTWEKLETGYEHIWAMGISSSGNIYAGTYGVGVIASPDNGDTWYVLNTGVEGDYVYSVSVSDLTISISTWTGGVYTIFENDGNDDNTGSTAGLGTWQKLGLDGQGVSALFTDLANNTMYAGTKTGSIFKVTNGLTSLKNTDEVIPKVFDLKQNYPNPFNPTTTIEFSIPKPGFYTLAIYNILGQQVDLLTSEDFKPGNYRFNFNASRFASGVYFYRLYGNGVHLVKKMMLLK